MFSIESVPAGGDGYLMLQCLSQDQQAKVMPRRLDKLAAGQVRSGLVR